MKEQGFRISAGQTCNITFSDRESEAVKIAANNLKQDLIKVFCDKLDVHICETESYDDICREEAADCAVIEIRTVSEEERFGSLMQGKKEAYRISAEAGKLIVVGADRRGTIYGIYELCEMLGVSPWYFWADVPVKVRTEFALESDFEKFDFPSVEYRGIFINDEEELEAWVKNRMGEETIGVKTYEKIFELLLRLKGNYIWPAMHVNSFNVKQENGALAERMGIVVGTSHCDMLMRSNNREWKPWLAKKGYEDVKYDYSLPGRNREILREYWRESVEQNREFEVCYTLGMRGIHDSGFETRGLKGLSGEELKQAKIDLLQQVMEDQCRILKDTLGHDTMMTFVPYKEVLPLYDGGLKVPEDITLVWSNDNYGHIRRYPSEQEKKRAGGNGVYYHNSYWAPPGMSYVFLCSIPLAHTANELRKAYAENIRKLWVMNVGAMKPLEQEITFFLRLGWEIGKENAVTEDVDVFVADWINRTFSGGIGEEVAGLLNDFSQLTNVRKPELMDKDTFSQTAYGDEAVTRIHEYERLFDAGNRIYKDLPKEEQAAFFELVLMRIHAAYFTSLAFYYGDRSTLANEQGKANAAALYVKNTRIMEDVRRKLVIYYNKRMLDGKWDGIINPEGFPPPRAAMMPVCTPPLGNAKGAAATAQSHRKDEKRGGNQTFEAGAPTEASAVEPRMCVNLWNDDRELTFFECDTKWLEVGNTGADSIAVEMEAPEWVQITPPAAIVETELRAIVQVKPAEEPRQGTIVIREKNSNKIASVTIKQNPVKYPGVPTEEDGLVFVRADSATELPESFRRIKRLGRGCGDLVEVCGETGPLVYEAALVSEGEFLLELHRFPSLDSVGRIRIELSVDGGERLLLESESRDEHLGEWRNNVRNNVDRLYLKLPYLKPGVHRFAFYPVDKYFAFSGFAVYTKPRKENNLAGVTFKGKQELPREFDFEKFAEEFYGEIRLLPRPVEYARPEGEYDTLVAADFVCRAEDYGKTVTPDYYLGGAASVFKEEQGCISIDAAVVLARTENAYTSGEGWNYCSSESFGRSGLAMYVREKPTLLQLLPTLNYRLFCEGGSYTVWMLSKFDKKEEAYFGVELDGREISSEELYNGGCLWRYEAEQIYRWVPIVKRNLSKGEHLLSICSPVSALRIDRLYITRGKELPPMDTDWKQ